MLKAELQKAYDEQKVHLATCRASLAEVREDLDEAKRSIDKLQMKYTMVEENCHAMRTIRMPHLELENETLKQQVSRLLSRVRQDDLAYKALAGVFKTHIQKVQSADFIWNMRDPSEKRDD